MARMLELDDLLIFQTVAHLGGITRAARQLHRVQSNITTRIKQLEARLGVALFLRQHRRLVLSPEGQTLLQYADQMLRLANEAESAMRQAQPQGVLRLGTLESAAAARLPPVLAQFHARYPAVMVELATGTTAALIRRVAAFELEAALVSEPFEAEGLQAQPLFREELVMIRPAGLQPAELGAQQTVVAFPAGCSYRRVLERWLHQQECPAQRVLELGSYHAIVACVAAGTGIGIVPRSVLAVVRAEPQVAVQALPPDLAVSHTCLVTRPGPQSLSLTALRGMLEAVARDALPGLQARSTDTDPPATGLVAAELSA